MLPYVLLLFWLVPAVTLVVVYCCDRLWAAVRMHVLNAPGRWPARADRVVRERAGEGACPGSTSHAAGTHLHVPLIIEDERGDVHMRHWHICLN